MSQEHVVQILAATNLIQLGFWGYLMNKLVNKLMCRNFAEYSMITNGPVKKEAPIDDHMAEAEEKDILNEVNAMFGVN